MIGGSLQKDFMKFTENKIRIMKGFATSEDRGIKALKIEGILKDYLKEEIKGFKILDLGCGSGLIGEYFSKNNEVFCADVEDQRKNKENTGFVYIKETKVDLEDEFFDIVISNHVIEHIKDQKGHLEEIRRVLKKDGVCYFAAPNRYFPVEPHYKIPLIHYLPGFLFLKLLKFLGAYKEDIYLLGYFRLTKLLRVDFKIFEYTHLILKNPEKFFVGNLPTKKLPIKILKKNNFMLPTNIFILKKK